MKDLVNELPSNLQPCFNDAKKESAQILNKIILNFPNYTDHSGSHSDSVIDYCTTILKESPDISLNKDELYILLMAALLHDVGMSVSEQQLKDYLVRISNDTEVTNDNKQKLIRDNHHKFSALFINDEWEALKIPNESYAELIALAAKGHRKVDLDSKEYEDKKVATIEGGQSGVRLCLLASLLRIADELDITKKRTPYLVLKYNDLDNSESIVHFENHTRIHNVLITRKVATIKGKCTDHNTYNRLLEIKNKIQETLSYCQKVLNSRGIYELSISFVDVEITPNGFNPISVKLSMDNDGVFRTLIGKNLYDNVLHGLRECISNAIDSCHMRLGELGYKPEIKITLEGDNLSVTDNGMGMSLNDIENRFAKIGVKSGDDRYIGQFGIGVTSYFLLADSYEVCTSNGEEHYKFTVTDQYNSFFNFDSCKLPSRGTQITFHNVTQKILPWLATYANDEDFYMLFTKPTFIEMSTMKNCVASSNISNATSEYLQHTFKYVTIPIILNDKQINKPLKDESISIEACHYYFQDNCEILISNNISSDYNRCSVYSNGVFVNYMLNQLPSIINIPDKPKNLGRSGFSNEANSKIMSLIFNALNDYFKILSSDDKVYWSKIILQSSLLEPFDKDYVSSLAEFLFFIGFNRSGEKIVYCYLDVKDKKYVLLYDVHHIKEAIKLTDAEIFIVLMRNEHFVDKLDIFVDFSNNEMSVIELENECALVINDGNGIERAKFSGYYRVNFINSEALINCFMNKYMLINQKHPALVQNKDLSFPVDILLKYFEMSWLLSKDSVLKEINNKLKNEEITLTADESWFPKNFFNS